MGVLYELVSFLLIESSAYFTIWRGKKSILEPSWGEALKLWVKMLLKIVKLSIGMSNLFSRHVNLPGVILCQIVRESRTF